jgi:hypothetical protein|nr:hypothetical protein SAMN05192547_101040 [Paraburkholderia sediminicola]
MTLLSRCNASPQDANISRCGMSHCFVKSRGAWHKPAISQCRPTLHIAEQSLQAIIFKQNF